MMCVMRMAKTIAASKKDPLGSFEVTEGRLVHQTSDSYLVMSKYSSESKPPRCYTFSLPVQSNYTIES